MIGRLPTLHAASRRCEADCKTNRWAAQNTMRKQDNSKASAGIAPIAEPAAAGGSPPEPKRATGPRDGLVLLCIIIVSAAISDDAVCSVRPVAAGIGPCRCRRMDSVHAHSQAGSEDGADRAAQGRAGARPRATGQGSRVRRALRRCRRSKRRRRAPSKRVPPMRDALAQPQFAQADVAHFAPRKRKLLCPPGAGKTRSSGSMPERAAHLLTSTRADRAFRRASAMSEGPAGEFAGDRPARLRTADLGGDAAPQCLRRR